MRIYKPLEFAEQIGVSYYTLKGWDNKDVLKAYRTPTNRRYYTGEQLSNYFRAVETTHDGRWIWVDHGKSKCSVCGAIYEYDDNFCGSCGARMVWSKEEKEKLSQDKELLK